MPYLLFEHDHHRHAGTIGGRLLIGRKPGNSIIINDPNVSRLHAWITQTDGQWVISDANSRTGTFINSQPIPFRHALADGDVIGIGPARMIFREEDIPEGLDRIDFPVRNTGIDFSAGGIQFDCRCGAPLWVDARHARETGACKYCGAILVIPAIPTPAPTVAPTVAPPEAGPAVKCSICHWPVEAGQESIACPECHLIFHAECWQENLGCSSYGCSQVNALAPKTEESHVPEPEQHDEPDPQAPVHHFPWDYVLLAAAVIAAPISAIAFGSLSLLTAFCSVIYLFMGRRRRLIAVVALALSLVGCAAGLYLSDWHWFNRRHLPDFLK